MHRMYMHTCTCMAVLLLQRYRMQTELRLRVDELTGQLDEAVQRHLQNEVHSHHCMQLHVHAIAHMRMQLHICACLRCDFSELTLADHCAGGTLASPTGRQRGLSSGRADRALRNARRVEALGARRALGQAACGA